MRVTLPSVRSTGLSRAAPVLAFPAVRMLGKTSGVSIKDLYELFPKGPAKVAAKIAGIPEPRGCI